MQKKGYNSINLKRRVLWRNNLIERYMKKLGFENIGQLVICILVIGGMIGFVVCGIMVNII